MYIGYWTLNKYYYYYEMVNFSIHKETLDCMHYLPVQSAFRRFLGVIVQHFENSFPKRTFTLTYKTRLPWMTPDLRHKICENNAMYKATLSDPQNKELLIEHKKKKNSLNTQLKNIEILYYSHELDINKHLNHGK